MKILFKQLCVGLSIPWIIIGIIYGWNYENLSSTDNINIVLTVLIVISGIEALIITAFFQHKTTQTNGLMHAFGKLNDTTHRENRGILFKKYASRANEKKIKCSDLTIERENEVLPEQKFPIFNIEDQENTELSTIIEQVRSDFDEIGSMLSNGLLPREPLLQVYWGTIIRSWIVLYGNTKHMRENVVSGYFMVYFQELAYEAWKYWEDHHKEKSINFFLK